MHPFREFADIHDIALILVYHTCKNTENENVFDQLSGTNGLLGAVDGAFLLYWEKGSVIPAQIGRDVPGQRMVLRFDREHGLWAAVSREEGAQPPDLCWSSTTRWRGCAGRAPPPNC